MNRPVWAGRRAPWWEALQAYWLATLAACLGALLLVTVCVAVAPLETIAAVERALGR